MALLTIYLNLCSYLRRYNSFLFFQPFSSLFPSSHCSCGDFVLFLVMMGVGGRKASLSSANVSNLILTFRLLNKAWIMTHNINNTNDSGSRHSWENLRATRYLYFYPISSLQYCCRLPWEFSNALKPKFEVAFYPHCIFSSLSQA